MTHRQSRKPPRRCRQLVAEADTGGRKPAGFAGKVIFGVGARLGAVPALVRVAAAVHASASASSTTPRRARSTWRSRCSSPSPRARRSSRRRATTCPIARLGVRARRRLRRRRTCSSSTASSRCGPGSRRRWTSSSRSTGILLLLEATRRAVGWPMAVLAVAVHRLHHGRAVPARRDRAQGRVARAPDLAHVAHDRGRVRHRARRVHRATSSSTCCSARCSTAPAAATT